MRSLCGWGPLPPGDRDESGARDLGGDAAVGGGEFRGRRVLRDREESFDGGVMPELYARALIDDNIGFITEVVVI